ncbi:MAG: cytochrome c [Gammaproteobacteria bacterium]|nr:cytochrome c [Gammaproteobacteria bacterium]MDH3411262.1 cytochrome c [Gammaproteobacteria bacterium]
MHRWIFSAPLTAALLMVLAGARIVAAEDDESTIKYRQSIMKSVGGHTGAIYEIVKNNNPNKDHLKRHASALDDLMGMVQAAFKRQTSGGKTRAKAEIWSDAAGFSNAASDAEAASGAFVAATESGNDGEIAKKLDELLDTCKGCHKNYREKKD